MLNSIFDFFNKLWSILINYYNLYSNFIHQMFPNEAGDFVLIIINVIIFVLVIKLLSGAAFKRN